MLILGLTLLPLRLFSCFICLTLSTTLAYIGLWGVDDIQLNAKPFTGWRLALRYVICLILRFMFVVNGFLPTVKGKQASPGDAPVICVAPHSTYFDSLVVCMMGAPCVVAKAETSSIPFWGALIRYSQPVMVFRNDPNSRQTTMKQIAERSASGSEWQQVYIFPEGTCTNRSSLITFRLGAFNPGVPIQPVLIRYENELDTVTWTWEGQNAMWTLFRSLSQFYVKMTVEYLPPYIPNQQEKEDPKLFSANLRKMMANELGVPTTDSNYYDYLRSEKATTVLKRVQKLQKKMEIRLVEATTDIIQEPLASEQLAEKLGVSSKLPELEVINELCQAGEEETLDLRNLRIAVLMATDEDSLESFLKNTFSLYDPELGDSHITKDNLVKVCMSLIFLTSKEATEMVEEVLDEGKASKELLKQYLSTKRPNYSKVIRSWEGGLVGGMADLLAMSASLGKTMEKVAQSGSSLISAGKEVVSDAVSAKVDKMSDVISSAVTYVHKRTGSRTEPQETNHKRTGSKTDNVDVESSGDKKVN